MSQQPDFGGSLYMSWETCQALIVGGIFDRAEVELSVRYAAISYLCTLHTKMKQM